MTALEWVRASQAILFEASIMPALVGASAAVDAGARFDPVVLALILASLVGIQAGANLFKGYYEGLDRSAPPSAAGSWLAFDSGAAVGLAPDPRRVLRIGYVCFGIGAVAGLALVAITRNVLLLLFGLAGALLAWSYSSPPLKLSYRGVGEVSTFLAFGPIMTLGSTVAFGGAGLETSLWASVALGFLASAISFARYFPNCEEDVAKGKRTPVTLLGVRRSAVVYSGLLLGPFVSGSIWRARRGGFLWILALAGFVVLIARLFPRTTDNRRAYERVIALTIAAHVVIALAMIADLQLGL